MCMCVGGRSSPRRSSVGRAELAAAERAEPAGYERYERDERDEPDLYAEQYTPYPR